jgi:Asparagine synthase
VHFTLAISAAARQTCAELIGAAQDTDPRVLPIPGPAAVAWRAPDERAAVLHWGPPAGPGPAASWARTPPAGTTDGHPAAASHAGTIWAGAVAVHARTGLARVDPVYLAEVPGAVLVSDRASWAAAVTRRLGDHDPAMVGAFLSMGYPIGAATPFRRVRALGCDRSLTVTGGRPVVTSAYDQDDAWSEGPGGAAVPASAGPYAPVAAALVDAVTPLRDAGVLVELSLTGGKDSRLIAAALTSAKVPFRARTHGSASHPDVIIAAMIAERLGVEHVVVEPRPPGSAKGADEADVIRRLRSAALVSDGMLSAFENVGWPDPRLATEPVQVGGHGGELLRGGYATAAWSNGKLARARSEARAPELFRRLTTRRLGLLRPAAAREYLAGLVPYAARLPRGPLRMLDDFYLVNRAGRWSATARQGYLMRSPLVQPFFSDRIVRAAQAVPLEDRITDRLHRGVLEALGPDLLGLPLAGSGWKSGPGTPSLPPAAPGPVAGPRSAAAPDWRRNLGDEMAGFLRCYALDLGGAGRLFDIVRRQAAEIVLRSPQADPEAAWALATLAALMSGDWLNARG